MNALKISSFLTFFFVVFATPSFAGGQYVDKTGFAISGYDVTSYWGLKQNPVGQAQPAPLPGKKSITADYNGAKWAFASEANRDKFLKDPAKYTPLYDGHCAYGASVGNSNTGGKVPANPKLWRIIDGKLYLNITETVVGFWERDIPGHIKQADKNWGAGLETKPASSGPVPLFKTDKAPI
ncbi:MAG: YHS domain-containing (seleno)protein [Pseudomonadota bacterium]